MLLSLTVSDFVLVERLELELGPDFTVLTGETGAGKSILLDALSLVLGERADGSVVRAGRPRAEVTAEFDVAGLPDLRAWLDDNGLEGEGDSLLLRRSVESGGRSRAFVNGHPATLQQLREAGTLLVDIHGQHAHLSLMQARTQRDMLDAYAQAEDLAEQTREAYRAWKEAVRRRAEAEARQAADEGERDRLEWLVGELTALDFRVEDWQALQEEHRRLSHAAELLGGSQEVVEGLTGEPGGALAVLRNARGRLEMLAEFDPRLGECMQLLDGSLIQAQEAAHEMVRYADRVDLDPAALTLAEERIARVMEMARRLRVTPEELPELLAESQGRLRELRENADLEQHSRNEAQAEKVYLAYARELSDRRTATAARLGEAVSVGRLLADLGQRKQVLCVTHLPQVAARADRHWVVLKEEVGGHARSRVQPLQGLERVEEIARMLGGISISETTRRHASEMLEGG